MLSRSLIVLFFLTLSSVHCQAQWDEEIASDLTFKGFSADLKYVAFQTARLLPNSHVRVSIYVVDVDKNSYAKKHADFEGDSIDQPELKNACSMEYAAIRDKFGVGGELPGSEIAFGEAKGGTSPFVIAGESYAVRVKNIPIPKTQSSGDGEGQVDEVMVQVDLVHKGNSVTLQSPEKAPSSWGRTTQYNLAKGYTSGNKVAFFIDYHVPGFEGPGKKSQMIVTGILQ